VMYAHGYVGPTTDVATISVSSPTGVSAPSIRRYLVNQGYAWAASSYSRNWYDVRAGIEDTNALALEFNRIAAARSRPLTAPTRTYIIGHSMGGHIAAAAVEAETQATARNKVRYDGSVPMCGVTGDTELFNTFAAMQVSAQAVAGLPRYPTRNWADISATVTPRLFSTFTSASIVPTADGLRYASIVKNLTGGDRPLFDLALAVGRSFQSPWGTFGSDGTVDGILNRNVLDTNRFTYTIAGDTAGSLAINNAALDLTADPDANRLRRDGLRWVPKVNGEFSVPVVTIHTLGDLFVPFSMTQIYRERAVAKGNGDRLVQRAIRGISHCDFTVGEQVDAFSGMVAWAEGGAAFKPAGDDVLTPATVAAPTYGCTFTRATTVEDSLSAAGLFRPVINANGGACPP
ncbi:MAG: alpha/beta hydrolase, partial [Rhizobacter sp.]